MLRSVIVLGGNFYEIYKVSPDSKNITEQFKAQYDEAQAKSKKLEQDIITYNIIAQNVRPVVPMIDGVVSARPSTMRLATISVAVSGKKLILDGFADKQEDVGIFVQEVKKNPKLSAIQMNTIEQREGKTFFQASGVVDWNAKENLPKTPSPVPPVLDKNKKEGGKM